MTPEASDTPKRARKARVRDSQAAPEPTVNIHVSVPNGDPVALAKAISTGSQKTRYEVSVPITDTGLDDVEFTAWRPVAELEAADADSALKAWATNAGDAYTGGQLRAVPVRNITQREGKVKLERQLLQLTTGQRVSTDREARRRMRACEASIKRFVRRIPRVVDAAERRRLYALEQQGVADPIRPRARTSRTRTLDEQRQLALSRELVDELTRSNPPPSLMGACR